VSTILPLARWILPLAGAAAGAALSLAGGGGYGFGFALVAGAALGLILALLLQAMATLVGHAPTAEPPSDRRLRQLENDKQLLLRSIREIEFDAKLQRVSNEEAAQLTEPLRQRAVRVLRDLDEARVAEGQTVKQRIEREVQRRLMAGRRTDRDATAQS
jgi:hypothetical protein